jgi:phosphate transport system permease protein
MTEHDQKRAAKKRLAQRYRAELRFKVYGLCAILFAASFLLFLLGDIIVKATPAFTAHWVRVNVEVSEKDIDPAGKRGAADIAKGDFQQPVREALQALFPFADTRAKKRALNGLLSSGGIVDFRRQVLASPELIGQRADAYVLLSADADMYLKGQLTAIQTVTGKGEVVVSGDGPMMTITSGAPDFELSHSLVKQTLQKQADAARTEAERFRIALSSADAAQRTDLAARIAALTQKANDMEAKATSTQSTEAIGPNDPSVLVRINGGIIKATQLSSSSVQGEVLLPVMPGTAAAGKWDILFLDSPESARRLNDQEAVWLEALKDKHMVEQRFNWNFFTAGDSREPELAGIFGALIGSIFTMAVTLLICLPVGVAAAIYLEEFAPKNRWTDLIEVNINNLAAVPSIVFGLLGLSIFLNVFNLPRSAPLVGGLVLALLVLPTIIIASRAALKAVPPSIREAALGVGASKQQSVFHHVLPLAMPGIMTGTIIGMAHALGETAPLLLIGMVAFIVDVPHSLTAAATALPVQIYLWSDLPELGFQAKTAAAILVLLCVLFAMNAVAVMLRRRFERRW